MRAVRPPTTYDPPTVRRFVLELDRRLEPLDRGILLAEWNLYSGRSRSGAMPWQLRRTALLSDPGLLRWTRRARRTRSEPLIARRLELLERVVLEAQVEQDPEVVRLRGELQQRIVAYRPLWRGRRVNRITVRRAVLNSSDARVRRRGYYALEPLHRPLEGPFRRLVRLRNDKARAAGFRSFAEMRLGFQGVTTERLLELAEDASRGLRSRSLALRDELHERERSSGWHPWDFYHARRSLTRLPDRSFPRSSMMARVLAAVGRWGFPVDRLRFRVVFHDLPAGGLTLAPDPPEDVRILVHPEGGWNAYHVLFHEVGHAVQSASIRTPRHLLRWHENIPGFGGFHEGIGKLFEEIPYRRDFLVEEIGVPSRLADRFVTARSWDDHAGAAGIAEWMLPELKLYQNPDSDPADAGVRFARRHFGYDRYPAPSLVDPFFVDTPLYAPNYLLAHLFHHQLAETLEERFGKPLWPNRRVGPWLTRAAFAPGSTIDWVPWLRKVTGRPFGAAAFRRRAVA